MSTVDTLITAVSAIAVNDVYRPYVRPEADERTLLRAARFSAVGVTVLGIALVPIFAQFKTIYAAHGAMTAAVAPPLVVALFMSVFWRRYTRAAALATIAGGLAAIAFSIFVPAVIAPFAHGVPPVEAGDGLFAGMRQYKFMRALYGLAVSGAIGVAVTLFTRPEPGERQRGLVVGTLADAIEHYKGSRGAETAPVIARAVPRRTPVEPEPVGEGELAVVRISTRLAGDLSAEAGDLVYVTDARRWLGGLFSVQAVVGTVLVDDRVAWIGLGPLTYDLVVRPRRAGRPLRVERLYGSEA